MPIEDLLKKLEPLLPEQVNGWRRALPQVNEGTRRILERHITAKAQDLLGTNPNARLLLPPPPEKRCRGTFDLGTVVYEQDKWRFSLREHELLQNLAIFGRSGAGKTNVAFHLLRQLGQNRVPFLFLDWKRTARHLLPRLPHRVNVYTPGRHVSKLPFNPLIPPPELDLPVHTQHLLDLLRYAYTLGDGSTHLLQQALTTTYKTKDPSWPTIQDVTHTLEGVKTTGRSSGWKTTALRALRTISFSDLFAKDASEQQEVVTRLTKENTVIELDGLNDNAKRFLVPALLLWIYQLRLNKPDRERLRLVVFIEEAHHVLHRQPGKAHETTMEQLLRQCRELGISIIIVDQHPHLISPAAVGNTYTTICLNLKDPTDINKAAALSLLRDDDKAQLSQLRVGEGIVKLQDRWRRPFLVRFPHIPVQKGIVTDAQVKQAMATPSTRSGQKHVAPHEIAHVRHVRKADIPIGDRAFALLHDVLEHPHEGVKQRYQRLGWSMHTGTRTKNQLVESGLLETAIVPTGNTRRLLLKPTRAASEVLPRCQPLARESIQHDYWKHYYANLYRQRGYQVELEASRKGGRVDVLATNASERVAIEIETGRSNAVQNLKNNLRSGFTRVVIIGTDDDASATLERQLARNGLLIPERVQLKRAGDRSLPTLTNQQ